MSLFNLSAIDWSKFKPSARQDKPSADDDLVESLAIDIDDLVVK